MNCVVKFGFKMAALLELSLVEYTTSMDTIGENHTKDVERCLQLVIGEWQNSIIIMKNMVCLAGGC